MKLTLSTIVSIVSLSVVLVSLAVTFGIQMERLDRLRDDVRELKATVEQSMIAIGRIENSRWRERQEGQ
jgi:hypothetical protein